ncbi:MAG: hypothetical protein LBF38_07570, partial [Deltaproteobacteria bacterium]|nr:hypothetical protein [Deltaproteobacteria bacterium]
LLSTFTVLPLGLRWWGLWTDCWRSFDCGQRSWTLARRPGPGEVARPWEPLGFKIWLLSTFTSCPWERFSGARGPFFAHEMAITAGGAKKLWEKGI